MRFQPEFCYLIVSFSMNMWRFVTVTSVKEEPIRSRADKYSASAKINRRHTLIDADKFQIVLATLVKYSLACIE